MSGKSNISLKVMSDRNRAKESMFRIEMLKDIDAQSELDALDKLVISQLKQGSIAEQLYLNMLSENVKTVEKKHGIYESVNRLEELTKDKNNSYYIMSLSDQGYKDWFCDKCKECSVFCRSTISEAEDMLIQALINFQRKYNYIKEEGVDFKKEKLSIESILASSELKRNLVTVVIISTIGGVNGN